MGELQISLLGPFQVVYDDRSKCSFHTIKEQALLAFLVSEAQSKPGILTSRETLVDLLWSNLPLDSARANLRQTVYGLRRVIPAQDGGDNLCPGELFISTRHGVGIKADYRYFLDVAEFCRQLSIDQLEQAVSLYRGEFLENLYVPDSSEFESWASGQRAELRRLAVDALDRLARRNLSQGRLDLAEQYARRQLALDDLQERAYRSLMEALARASKRSSALQQYEICRRRLAHDLGISPSKETDELLQRIVEGALTEKPETAARAASEQTAVRVSDSEQARAAGPAPIFVGRERELAALSNALASSYAGQGQVRFVIGGAGRGKTALVSEFARQALFSNPDLLAATGYCRDQAGYGDPYAPFREVLAALTGGGEPGSEVFHTDSLQAGLPETAAALVVPLLLAHAPDLIGSLVPADELMKRAAALSGPESPWIQSLRERVNASYKENIRQDRLFEQVTTLLKRTAAERPLLIVLEDLHLADSPSVALLFHISRVIGDSRILLAGTYRPEEMTPVVESRADAPLAAVIGELKRRHGDIWLDLAKMSEAEGRAFVDLLLDSEPNRYKEAFRRSFFEHTGGHALFAVELLRDLKERGDLVQCADGRWLAGESINWSTLPARVEGVIEQRLGRLDAGLQEALTIASVEGETFTAEVVARILQKDGGSLVRRLGREASSRQRLVEAESVTRIGEQRLSLYRFRHQLFRHYLYHSLDQAEQTYLHEEVGRALEAVYGPAADQAAVRLAWHFEKAGLMDDATAYLVHGARQAVHLGAHAEAIAHASHGLELLKHAPQSRRNSERELDLLIILGNAFVATNGFGSREAGEVFERAYELCARIGHTPQIFPVLSGLWGYYIHRADYQTALKLAAQAQEMARQAEESGAMLNAYSSMGVTLYYLGDFASAYEQMERVIEIYDPAVHGTLGLIYGQDPGVCALSVAALALMRMGYPERALAYSDRALQLARDLSYPFALAFTLLLALWLHASRYNMRALLEIVEEQIALTSEHGFPLQLAIAEFDKYWAQGMLGEGTGSLSDMERALSDWEATGAKVGKSVLLGGMAEVCLKAGRIVDGLNYVEAGIEHCQSYGEACYTADLYRIRANLLWAQGLAAEEVEAEFIQAIDLARQQDARLLVLRATSDLCRLWQGWGREEEAVQALTTSYRWFSEGFDEPALREARQLIQALSERWPLQKDRPAQPEDQAAAHDGGLPQPKQPC